MGVQAISEEQVAQYQRDGAILIRNALDVRQIALLERGLEEAYATRGDRYSIVRSPEGEGETLVEQFGSTHCPSLRALIEEGRVAEIAARLMDVPSAQLLLDQIFYKTRGFINPTPWHQDTPYLRLRGHDMARVWLTCDPSPKALTVQVVRGSHRWNVVYDTAIAAADRIVAAEEGGGFTYAGVGLASAPKAPDVARYRDSFDILTWDVEPGDAVVFNGNVLHGAQGCADHGSPRRAFATLWGGPEVRYVHPPGNAVPTLAEINMIPVPEGARIGDHEAAFPVGWRAASNQGG